MKFGQIGNVSYLIWYINIYEIHCKIDGWSCDYHNAKNKH
jgi:hypothetical protein